MRNEVSIERLHEVFNADYANGKLYRKNGKEAGGLCPVGAGLQYRRFMLDGKSIYTHRALVAMRTGEWPHTVDHVNGDTLDNSETNLVVGDTASNMRNRGAFRNGSKYGRGINYIKFIRGEKVYEYYSVTITCDGKQFRKLLRADKPRSLLEAQFFALRVYIMNGFPERHYQSVKDAMLANPDFVSWDEAMNADIQNIQ